jgi:hypothetical protein
MENFKMTNVNLIEKFKAQLIGGNPVVFDVRPNENGKEQHSIYVAQFVPVENPLVAALQGWSPIVTRAVMSVSNEVLENNQEIRDTLATVGNELVGYSIQFKDTVEKPYTTAEPRLTRTEEGFNAYLSEEDKYIYRTFELVEGQAKNVVLETPKQVKYEITGIENEVLTDKL